MLSKYIKKFQDEIAESLIRSARSYYKTGISLFHELKIKTYLDYQPAIGNLCVSVELLLKAVIAKKALRHLYLDIPAEVQIMLTYPDSMPTEHNPREHIPELQSFSYNTIDLNQAVSYFYNFFPQKKQEFKVYLSFLSSVRNVSLHASLPTFQRYDLERIAFISTKLFMFIEEQRIFKYLLLNLDDKTKRFLANYEEAKISRVKKSIEEAKKKSKKITHLDSHLSIDDGNWNLFVLPCTVCGCDGFASGYTEHSGDNRNSYLTFLCESYECDECGLVLEDYEEMEMAGFETSHDRTDEMKIWKEDHDYDD